MKDLKKIKFIKKDKRQVKIDGILYTPFKVGDLPKRFGFIYDTEEETEGICQWFNYKGLTYINLD